MKHFALVLLLAFTGTAFATESKTTATKEDLKLIKAGELQQMSKDSKASVFVFDANDDQTRQKEGVIPGAIPLKSTRDYDLAVLPKDKKANLVFYCGGPLCMASHEAAKRAKTAGYANVTVMSDGITGWKKAGFETKKFTN